MKDFSDRLHGRKGGTPDANKQAAAAKPRPSPAEPFQPHQTGHVIAGKYEVLRVLGKGGFGIVYHMRFFFLRDAYERSTVAGDGSVGR